MNRKLLITTKGSVLFIIAVLITACASKKKNLENITSNQERLSNSKIAAIFQVEKQQLSYAWKTVKRKGKLPRSIDKGYRPIDDWTSGFYPGNLWLVYEYTHDQNIKRNAEYATALLEEEKYNTRDHDIGFRIYCSYGNGYRLTQSSHYKDVIIQAAESAIQRYSPKVKAIMSWEPNSDRDWQFPVIIDNMINLELLFAATHATGDSIYYKIAVDHAITTMKNQFRDNYSCSHVVDYDSITGQFRKMDWNNGNNDPSIAVWSRGQSWGLYGYTMMFRETGDKQFLIHAEKIADFILNHPNMPKDMIPYWDYSTPEIPTARDASAAAIMASALMELSGFSPTHSKRYFEAGEKILESLSSSTYLAQSGTNGNFLLKHATGNFVRKSEVDGTLIYADYYFLEALLRYTDIKKMF